MTWDVEYTDEPEEWWDELTEAEHESVDASERLLDEKGPQLRFLHSSGIEGFQTRTHAKLRVQDEGRPYRVLYVFDPRRSAILLIGRFR